MNQKPDWGRESASPSGQVRVLVLGDSGVGKTSLVHLIVNESFVSNPRRTIGCAVDVKHLVYRESKASSYTQKYKDRNFFVELWDVSGHQQYKDCRSIFYSQISGVIFVHDLSQRKTKGNLQDWASEVASQGSFSAPLPPGSFGSLPVPILVVGNKSDLAPKHGAGGSSSSNLVDAARQWVEKQGFMSPTDELPTTQSFPVGQDLRSAAKDGLLDLEAVRGFFFSLIQRRYYPEDVQPSMTQRPWEGLRPTGSAGSNLFEAKRLSFDDHITSSRYNWLHRHSRWFLLRVLFEVDFNYFAILTQTQKSFTAKQLREESIKRSHLIGGSNSLHKVGHPSLLFGSEPLYNAPWARQERLSPPTTPSPEKPFSRRLFLVEAGPVPSYGPTIL